jgi:GR25 family glycosyltransferase involved in LPS biosynthesis
MTRTCKGIKGFYINLESRDDRNNHIKNLINKYSFFSNIERFNAIKNKRGDIGCTLSHITCLTKFLEMREDYYLLIEDDFFIFNDENFNNFTSEFEKIKDSQDWDMIILTPRGDVQTKNFIDGFHKITNNQTTTGYIVKHNFIKKLLEVYQKGLVGLIEGKDPNYNALDQCWKPLQKETRFLYYKSIYAGQLPSYSDIEGKVVNYNKRFMEQET